MPLSATARIQSASGLASTVNSGDTFTATLPNPTMGGSTLMMWLASAGGGASITNPPQGWDPPLIVDAAAAGFEWVWRRDSQPLGETSWVFTPNFTGISANWAWWIEEWAGWATIGQPEAIVTAIDTLNNNTTNPAVSGSVTPGVTDYAALAFARAGTTGGAAVWPAAHSWGSGWNEVAWLTSGTGAGSNDFSLGIAEAYPGTTTSMQASLNWDTSGGGTIPVTTHMWFACYQPAAYQPIIVSAAP